MSFCDVAAVLSVKSMNWWTDQWSNPTYWLKTQWHKTKGVHGTLSVIGCQSDEIKQPIIETEKW